VLGRPRPICRYVGFVLNIRTSMYYIKTQAQCLSLTCHDGKIYHDLGDKDGSREFLTSVFLKEPAGWLQKLGRDFWRVNY
jgi:hypothetical protein